MSNYTWRQGATIRFALEVISGTVTGDETVRCALKATSRGEATGSELMEFDVTYVPASGGSRAKWSFFGSVAQGNARTAGLYVADARITLTSDVVISEMVNIRVVETVTTA